MPVTRDHMVFRFLAAPTDVGFDGHVKGGKLLEWIDKACFGCAAHYSRADSCVTAYVGNVDFTRPIAIGDLVEIHAQVVLTGRSSMHIVATVFAAAPGTELVEAFSCNTVFVALDKAGRSTPVPAYEPKTDAEREAARIAQSRIGIRRQIEQALAEQSYTDDSAAPSLTMRFLAAPTDVNWGGKVHGGYVMAWIDEAAYAVATQWSKSTVVSRFSGGVRFYRPMRIGDLMEIEARLIHTGTSSMHVSVHVRSGSLKTGEMRVTTHCLTIMVAIDDSTRHPIPVRPWRPELTEDIGLDDHAVALMGLRLATRSPEIPLDDDPTAG